jgi:hypothetical protein
MNRGAVRWKSSKQETLANSTIDSEYIAAFEVTKEGIWMGNFLMDLAVAPWSSSPLDVYYDNCGAITQAKEPRWHQKNEHILRRYHLIRQFVEMGDIKLYKIHTDANVADPLTKPLPQPKSEAHTRVMAI